MKEFETNQEIIYSLIIDDLDESITAENKNILERWRNASTVNDKLYQDLLKVHSGINRLHERDGYNAQSSWEALENKINIQAGLKPVHVQHAKSARLWLGIAASLLILLSVGYYFIIQSRYEVINTGNNSAHVKLPDGSQVDLNSATTIRYNKKEFLKDRKLELLSGEIFINVAGKKLPQFKVILDELEALDIGTSFNIVKTDKKIIVIVENGKVLLKQILSDKQILITAGKSGIYNKQNNHLEASDNLDMNYKSWINKQFVFNEIPLYAVADELEKVYHVPIVIEGKDLMNRKLTAKLQYQTLDSAIAVISASLQCKAIKSKGTYIISED